MLVFANYAEPMLLQLPTLWNVIRSHYICLLFTSWSFICGVNLKNYFIAFQDLDPTFSRTREYKFLAVSVVGRQWAVFSTFSLVVFLCSFILFFFSLCSCHFCFGFVLSIFVQWILLSDWWNIFPLNLVEMVLLRATYLCHLHKYLPLACINLLLKNFVPMSGFGGSYWRGRCYKIHWCCKGVW